MIQIITRLIVLVSVYMLGKVAANACEKDGLLQKIYEDRFSKKTSRSAGQRRVVGTGGQRDRREHPLEELRARKPLELLPIDGVNTEAKSPKVQK